MSSEKFFNTKKALVTLIAASLVVIVSLGIRQTFGLFFFDFNADLNISISHFGFVSGLQLLMWGVFSPIFGYNSYCYEIWNILGTSTRSVLNQGRFDQTKTSQT